MDVEHSTEDNSKVEREGLEEYEQDVVEEILKKRRRKEVTLKLRSIKSSEANGDACTRFMSRILKMFFMKKKVKTIWAGGC